MADILVSISKTSQRMIVLIDGTARYTWLVSTGAKRHTTPTGVYKPQWLAKKWRSRQYNNAPMPHSIFFHKGYAIHGTTDIKRLGKIASHGCVRLHPDHAATLYSLVQKQMAHTRLVVSDDIIELPGQAPKQKTPGQYVAENTADEELPGDGKLEMVALAQGLGEVEIPLAADTAPAAETSLAKAERAYAKAPRIAKPPRPAPREKVARANRPGFHW